MVMAQERLAGCSKRPDFSPAQPWRAETHLVPSTAAASEEARRTLRYIESLSDARTKLADFFSILLTNFGSCCGTAELLEQTSCRSKANGDV
jgi:hypothetical protein